MAWVRIPLRSFPFLPVVSGDTDLPQLDYATLVAAGVFVPEWLNADLDGEWMFDLTAPAAYRSRVGSAILNPAGKTVSLVTGAAAGNHLQIDSGKNEVSNILKTSSLAKVKMA